MKKNKTVYVCQQCGAQYPRWLGRCTECGEWNTLVEETMESSKPSSRHDWLGMESTRPELIEQISEQNTQRMESGYQELDRVLGGGIVPGSMILFGGEPGIGKSTLLLQLCLQLSDRHDVLYISGEESPQQIKMRAKRLGFRNQPVKLMIETALERIIEIIQQDRPRIVIIDSIQTVYSEGMESAPGSVGQVKNAAASLLRLAKQQHITFFLIGHITKEGTIAGPKVLEHMVDTVLYFEGDRLADFRIIRAVKNRFGAIGEVGVFQMSGQGLNEILNPSAIFMPESSEARSGVSISSSLEGTRAFLIEIQSLASPANFGYPQRVANGIDNRRLSMLLAVLEKKLHLRIGMHDIFVNLIGGIQVKEPGIDLAIAMAIYSSFQDLPLDSKALFLGELGLTGEIRPVSQPDLRIKEADKLGFTTCYLSHFSKPENPLNHLKLIKVKNLKEVIDHL